MIDRWPQMKDPTCTKTLRPVYGPQSRPIHSQRGSPGFTEEELAAGRLRDEEYQVIAIEAMKRRNRLNGI